MLILTFVLVCLAVPLVALQLLVIAGMFRGDPPAPSEGAPAAGRTGETEPISVVLPAHDEEARLPAALASLAAVRYDGPHEFIVVDDRSTDGTAAVIDSFVRRDPRFKRVAITAPDRRYAPKVNAVMRGIAVAEHDVILTTDADCRVPPTWLAAMARELKPGVAMVSGYVEVDLGPRRQPLWSLIEAAEWFSLMLTSRSLLRFGFSFASSANNQAYRRSALRSAGGFGASARAPSADEDLLAQRLGRLPGSRVVFAAAPDLRVTTSSVGGPLRFLRQRARWVSRYRHVVHYRPGFIAGLAVLGFESLALCAASLSLPWLWAATYVSGAAGSSADASPLGLAVAGVYAAQVAVHWAGMNVGAGQLDRRHLGGWVALAWALCHPWIIATAVVWSWVAPGDWRAGAVSYRRSLLRRRWRLLKRSLAAR